MLSWTTLKGYIDSKGCDRNIWRPVGVNMWLEHLWNDAVMNLIEVLCGLKRMWKEVFTTSLRYYVDCIRNELRQWWPNLRWYVYWNIYEWKISRPIWGTMLIVTDDRGYCHDLVWSVTMIRKDVTERFYDQLLWKCDWKCCETTRSWLNLMCYVD
jgi:hypothetical protein